MMSAKHTKLLIIGFCVFWGAIILFNLVRQSIMGYFLSHYEPPPVAVSSIVVKEKTWHPYLHSVGNFMATRGVEVNSQVSGNVIKVHFESGQYVEANSPLVDLDDGIEQSTLKFNQAELQLKSINFVRLNELSKRNATSISSLDEAKASLQQAEANVEKIKTEIRLKHITAPFSGELGIRQVNLGQYVSAGQTHIVTLQTLDPLYLNFYVPEQYYKLLYVNQPMLVKIQEFPHLRFMSKITAINPKADTDTHNIEIQATMPNCPADLLNTTSLKSTPAIKFEKKPTHPYVLVTCDTQTNLANPAPHYAILPGMFASIAVTLSPKEHVLVLPTTAISFSLYGNAVYLILPQQNKAKDPIYHVKRVFVQTGEQQGNETVILSGLKPGDLVVSAGELKLQNDTRVIINNDVKLKNEPDFSQMEQ